MLRKDKEITDRNEAESIIEKSQVCRLAMADEGEPYVVPLCFGYRDNALYFHAAQKGKKLDILRKNKRVCFEFDIGQEVKPGEKTCKWGMKYQSVIGFGDASFVEDTAAKCRALDIIMQQYSAEPADSSAPPELEYPEASLKITTIIKVDIREMTGKRSV